jgi:MIP family channel proteins
MRLGAWVAEFIGTMALCFIGICAVADPRTGLVGVALAHGLTIACFVAAFVGVSGAHFNPAVSLAMFLTRRIGFGSLLAYLSAELSGAWVGAALAKALADPFQLSVTRFGIPALGVNVSEFRGLGAEVVLTFFLVLVIFMVAVDPRSKGSPALPIGFTVAFCILAGAAISGAGLNPARWFGSAVVGGGFAKSWLYVGGPLIGGVLAALIYAGLIERHNPNGSSFDPSET